MSVPVRVPAAYIANKSVDFVEEILSALHIPLTVGRLVIPPPVMGCFSLLELIDSDFFRRGARCDFLEFGRAMAIFTHRKAAGAWVRDYIADKPETLDAAARECMQLGGNALIADLECVAAYCLEAPFTGFEMIPGTERPATAFLFDGVVLGSLALLGGRYGSLTPEAALWETPVALLGHLAAANAKAQGTQGVGRPKDPDDIRRQLRLARERAERGEPQPWEAE